MSTNNSILIGSLTRLYHDENCHEVNEELLDRLLQDNKITETDKILIMAGIKVGENN
jgi:hypothetical protein